MSDAAASGGWAGCVEDILITPQLAIRPSRAPDHAAESRALTALAQEMVVNPGGVLEKCAKLVMELCHADSAGISVLEPGGTEGIFRWRAASGALGANLGGTMPREASPCGTVIARNSVLLFNEAERFFPALRHVEPRIYENLLAPWHADSEAVGTLWAIKHSPEGRFDAEDARLLASLARFAAAAYQMTTALAEAKAGRDEQERRLAERALADTALRASEERLRALLNATSYVLYRMSPDWAELRQFDGQGSASDTERPSQAWLDEYIHPDDQPLVLEAIQEAIRTKSIFELEHRVRRTDGSLGWTLSRAVPLLDAAGEIREWFGAASDVTARKRAEEALRESEARFRLMTDAIPQIVWITDAEGGAEFFNRQWSNYTGASYAPTTAAEVAAGFVHPDDAAVTMERFDEARRTGTTFLVEHRLRSKEGDYRWFLVRGEPHRDPHSGQIVRWYGASMDIHDRKRAETEQRRAAAAASLRAVLSEALRPLSRPVEIQAEAIRMLTTHLNASRAHYVEMEPDGEHAVVADDYAPAVPNRAGRYRLADFVTLISECRAGRNFVVQDIAADPRLSEAEKASFASIPVAAMVTVPLVKDGRLVALLAVHHVVSHAWMPDEVVLIEETAERIWAAIERARSEAALRESEARLRIATEANGIGTWELLVRGDGATSAVTSARHDAIFGYPEPVQEWNSEVFLSHVLFEDRDAVARALRHAVEAGETWMFEARIRLRRDGELRWIEVHGQPMEYEADGRAVRFVGIVQDITERKAAEERQTLLAREVDHRAKNALAVVQSLLRLTPACDPVLFKRTVEGRISALARAQTLLAEDRWKGADLRALLEGEFMPFRGDGHRVTLEGPPVALPPGAAQPLAMAAHELATNALKHGALSAPTGSVSVSWRLEGGPGDVLRLRWTEEGGPQIERAPKRRGFGSRVLDGTMRRQLGGAVSLAWERTGLVCEIEVPLGHTPASTEAEGIDNELGTTWVSGNQF